MKKSKEIDLLYEKVATIEKRINKIEEEEQKTVQLPRCRNMVGWCLKSSYDSYTYAKILEFVEPKNAYYTFIMEYMYVNDGGIASIQLYDQSPYLNKEWWESEVPMSGWKRITDLEYEKARVKVVEELSTRNKLRKHIGRYK